jgi:hypothetical protein
MLVNENDARPERMGKAFLDLAYQGKTRWGIYLLGIMVIAGVWILGSVMLLAVVFGGDFSPATTGRELMDGSRPIPDFVAICLTFVALLIGVYFAVCLVHRRPFLSLVTPFIAPRWRRLWQGFRWQIVFIILSTLAEELLFPSTYTYSPDADQFYKFALLVVLFIPLQAASEELLFRGYLLQTMGLFVRRPAVLMAMNGLVFMALHAANPEIEQGLPAWLAYFSWGAFLTLVTLKDNGAELAIGIHIANNVFTGIFTNYKGSALPTNTVFQAQEIHPWYGLLSYILSAAALYWLLCRDREHEAMVGPVIQNNDAHSPEEKSYRS